MKYFDLHCDTILEAYERGTSIIPAGNGLQISLEKAEKFEKYTQVLGIFSTPDLGEEGDYQRCLKIIESVKAEKASYPANFSCILAVEGANLLAGKLDRVDKLRGDGVRIMTLVWGGSTCIGGAHNDGGGFTEFGREAARRCFEVGIVPDMSHASDKLFWECAELSKKSGKPIIATHSNSRAVCDHTRNLTDEMFGSIRDDGGVVGISMVRGHLKKNGGSLPCGIPEIISHIEHYFSIGGEDTVAFGCDFDGTDVLPDGITGVSDIDKIAEELAKLNYTQTQIDKIYWRNAQNFMLRNEIL